jgi:two-component system chemotaxis response regulator CheB
VPNIIVIGASAGGVEPLRTIIKSLPADLPAALFVVMHLAPTSPSVLPSILRSAGGLEVNAAVHGEEIRPGHVFVARPDMHLLIEPGYVRLTRGPRENRHRPAIDPLFRTAARAYGSRVLGIVLTGMLDDGAQGLAVIKAEGGTTIVQNPDEAMFSSMPRNAMQTTQIDHVAKAAEIPELIRSLARERWQSVVAARARDIRAENPRMEGEKMDEQYDERRNGKPSMFTCPDCSGTLWEVMDGDLLRFRCRVGHAFSPESMRQGYTEWVEGALWSAVRVLEESASLERRLAGEAASRGDQIAADRFSDVAIGREQQAAVIRDILMAKGKREQNGDDGGRGL